MNPNTFVRAFTTSTINRIRRSVTELLFFCVAQAVKMLILKNIGRPVA